MSYLTTQCGKQVYFESYGDGDVAMVLVHGWGMSVRTWDHVLPSLRDAGLRVVLMDHRGCGASSKDFADMSIHAIANDLVNLVHELNLKKVVLNGWSLGGAVVVDAANQLADICCGLVLTGGASPAYVQMPDFPYGGTKDDMAATLAALSQDRVNFLHGLAKIICAKEVGENIENWFWQIFLQSSPLAAQTLGDLANLDQREVIKKLNLPILSFVGDQDAFVAPDIGRWVGHNHPRSQVVEYPGVGHAPFIEVQEQYLEALTQFCRPILQTP
ncbi:MAG: alpha/beta hydrolase [Gammaproteobacteria bacterium]|jgi:non-heme chloroperoxidase|nr:alpha/beta hydrolase [Gammaproteobacteria bacterium]